MAVKKQVNFSIPEGVTNLFDELTSRVTEKQKWIVISGALLAYAGLSQESRERYQREVAAADVGNGIDELLLRAKSGELRRQAENGGIRDNPLIMRGSDSGRREAARARSGRPKSQNDRPQ